MRFIEAVRLAFQTIRTQKLKSAFSIIGVFIGVMFLIAVVSVVQGMNRYMTDKFAGTLLGVNTFRLRQFPDVQIGNVTDSLWRSWMRRPRVTYDDAQAVMRGLTVPVLTAWEASTRTALFAGRRSVKDVQVTAATAPLQRYGDAPRFLAALAVKASSTTEMREAMQEAEAVMRSRRHLRPRDENNFAMETADEVLDVWGKISKILFVALPGLVAISLVVGGIVIMNIML